MAGRDKPDRNVISFGPTNEVNDTAIEDLRSDLYKETATAIDTATSAAATAAAAIGTGVGGITQNITNVAGSVSEKATINTYNTSTNSGTCTGDTTGAGITYSNGTGTVLYAGDRVVILKLTDGSWLVLAVISRVSTNPLPTPGNPTYPYTPVTGFPQDLSADARRPYPNRPNTVITWSQSCGIDVSGTVGFGANCIITSCSGSPTTVVAFISAGAGAITYLSAPSTPDNSIYCWQQYIYYWNYTDSSSNTLFHRWSAATGWENFSIGSITSGHQCSGLDRGGETLITISGVDYLYIPGRGSVNTVRHRLQLGSATWSSAAAYSAINVTVPAGAANGSDSAIIANGYIWARQTGGSVWYRQPLTSATSYTTGWSAGVSAPGLGSAIGVDSLGNLVFLSTTAPNFTWGMNILSVTGAVTTIPNLFSTSSAPSSGEPGNLTWGGQSGYGNARYYQVGPDLWAGIGSVSLKYIQPTRTYPVTHLTQTDAQSYQCPVTYTVSSAGGYIKWYYPTTAYPDILRSSGSLAPRARLATGVASGYFGLAVYAINNETSLTPTTNHVNLYPL